MLYTIGLQAANLVAVLGAYAY